jgi:SAM-dependent methyltransferase
MNPNAYTAAASVEDRHWWFSGRREIIDAVLRRFLAPQDDCRILEIGCGNGGNLPLLARYGAVYAVELDDDARARAAARGVARVEAGALPDPLPFPGLTFDVIAALDVLEHVADDRRALGAVRARLTPRGLLVLTVPAYMWLWSGHDEISHHHRRYAAGGLVRLVESAGFEVAHASYFNTLLFPLGVARTLSAWLGAGAAPGLRIPPGGVNEVLHAVLAAERHLVSRASLPFGMSIVVCGRAR